MDVDNDGRLVDNEKTITDQNAKIPSKYNFMPNFSKLDGIIVESDIKYKDEGDHFIFNLADAARNSISVTYKNVGTYNGKVIDLKLSVKDWVPYPKKDKFDIFVYKNNGIKLLGVDSILLNYSFLDNATLKNINVSGFFNFTDIDYMQSIDIFNNNNIKNFYATKDNKLAYKDYGDYIQVGETKGVAIEPDNKNYWITYTYSDTSNFDIRFRQGKSVNGEFFYSFQAPNVIEETPKKEEPKKEEPKFIGVATKNETPQAPTLLTNKKIVTEKTTLPATGENSNLILAMIGFVIISLAGYLNKVSFKKD